MNLKNNSFNYIKLEFLLISAAILTFIFFRLYNYFETDYFVIWFDSAQYASVSLRSVWSKEFWSDGIPPLYPFFLKYFHLLSIGSTESEINVLSLYSFTPMIVKGLVNLPDFPFYFVKDNFTIIPISLLQLFFSIFSWVVFSLSFSFRFKLFYIKLFSIILILLIGSESSVILWDKQILTESFSISLLVLTFSCLVHMKIILNKNIYIIFFILILVFLSFIKITNNYLLMLLIPFMTLHFWMSGFNNKLKYYFVCTAILSLFTLNQYILFKGDRTHVPMKDLISSRISTTGYEDIYDYFKDAGMPKIPKYMIGKSWTAPFEDYPELYDWWLNKSSHTYQKYLISHPGYFFLRPFQYKNNINKPVYNYLTPKLRYYDRVTPHKLQIIFTDTFLYFIFVALSVLYFFIPKENIKCRIDDIILSVFVLLSGIILYLIIWHADHGELDRHLLQCAIIIRIGLIMLLPIFIDALVRVNTSAKLNPKCNSTI